MKNLKPDGRLFYRITQQIKQFSHQTDKERNIVKGHIINN